MDRLFVLFVFSMITMYCVLVNQGAFATDANNNNTPLEITADQSMEWHRAEKFFIARKNVLAVQGASQLKSALLTAKYNEGKASGIKIHTLIAEGGVVLINEDQKAYGDRAVYNIDKNYAEMTGKNLRIISPDQEVTAKDRFEYWALDGRLNALGDVVALRGDDKIESQKMSVFFAQNGDKKELKRMEAEQNVIITTPDEVLRGDKGIYNADTNNAELIGHVTITRGKNILQGERATVDLNTNVSKIFGGSAEGQNGGRVKAVFFPNSEQ